MFNRMLCLSNFFIQIHNFVNLCQKNITTKMSYYAVANGRNAGVFHTWSECEDQVKGYSGARYKKFNSEYEAQSFIQEHSGASGGYTGFVGGGDHRPNVRFYSTTASSVPIRTFKTTAGVSKSSCPELRRKQIKGTNNIKNKNMSFNIDDLDDPIAINDAVCKQLDALESRLKGITKNVDKIYDGCSKPRGKRTLPTEPHHLNKCSRAGEHEVQDNGYIQVYTDGACSSNGQSGARAGYGVWWGDDHPLNESGRVGRATNNSGEIRAAVRACQQARDNGINKLCINTDSKFLINSATKWMPEWKNNNWKLKSGGRVKNTADFQALERASYGLDVQWRHVDGHSGIHGNEYADQLARHGAAGEN